MNRIQNTLLIILLLLTANVVAGFNKLNPEVAAATYIVKQVNYQAKIIYVDGYELSYNANTKFITEAGLVKPTALTPGSQVRFVVSNKKLQSLRTIVSEVMIRTAN